MLILLSAAPSPPRLTLRMGVSPTRSMPRRRGIAAGCVRTHACSRWRSHPQTPATASPGSACMQARSGVVVTNMTCPHRVRAESARDRQAYARAADSWAICVTFYFLLYGRWPFTRATIQSWATTPPAQFDSDVQFHGANPTPPPPLPLQLACALNNKADACCSRALQPAQLAFMATSASDPSQREPRWERG